MDDHYDFTRFIEAQREVHPLAIKSIRAHSLPESWAPIIFPPMAILSSDLTDEFALRSVDEAEAFLEHPLLGNEYREAVEALGGLSNCTVTDVFGPVGADTVHSSLTLFALATAEPLIREMLSVWYDGLRHERTMQALGDDW